MNLSSLVMTIAALQGAGGVSLAAAAAHVDANPLLATASQFLMIHAAAGLGLGARLGAGAPLPRFLAGAAFAMQAGVTLFAADLAARVYLGGKLFPFAAPMGGGLTILAWLALALWGAATLLRRD
ncbi:DUF423 domain-containing protein [Methylocystis echinoides]|jgi:uncharacterized membrane protein YgdD (TMEM256/DUF423 family)|uniref:DUF423 domain-containing protein n=1 Tax=Methylocystis echinoides TaxID=29468 RepID=A0A9W6GV96_9HYPH|nr:DUF423 domain-containing protein [Methylocystis echinoides]GLI93702.1 hypothetical protein LMG27198_26940 [Methylocystis echinoides]